MSSGAGITALKVGLTLVVVVVLLVYAVIPASLTYFKGSGVRSTPCLPTNASTAPAAYDEQLLLVQHGNSTNVSFTVDAVAQEDANGYGPAYLVNGLTDQGFWYQAGIGDNVPCSRGFVGGFHFLYQVWGPGHITVFGPGLLPLSLRPGDSVNLSLTIRGSDVLLEASDLTDGATQSVTYPAEGASEFLGGTSDDPDEAGYFTGPMTEWYHVAPYYGGEAHVTFDANTPIAGPGTSMVTLAIEEVEPSNGTEVFSSSEDVQLGCKCTIPFTYEGATEEVSSTIFATG